MKNIKQITGQILILVFTFNVLAPVALAETKPEQACVGKKPNYEILKEEWDKTKIKNRKAYDEAFEKAREAHHN